MVLTAVKYGCETLVLRNAMEDLLKRFPEELSKHSPSCFRIVWLTVYQTISCTKMVFDLAF